MKLRYYIPIEKSSGYSTRNVLKRFNREDFSHELKSAFNGNRELHGYISTQVWGFLFWKRWVLVLDCDSSVDRDKAIEEVRSMELKYDTMESSPGKFWIIVNYTGSLKKCINLMQAIPGVDRNFIRKCEYDRKIVLRAFPKDGFIPRTTSQYLSEWGSAGDWFHNFKTWWESGTIEWLANHQRVEIQTANAPTATQVEQAELEALRISRESNDELEEYLSRNKSKKKLRLIRLEKEDG